MKYACKFIMKINGKVQKRNINIKKSNSIETLLRKELNNFYSKITILILKIYIYLYIYRRYVHRRKMLGNLQK